LEEQEEEKRKGQILHEYQKERGGLKLDQASNARITPYFEMNNSLVYTLRDQDILEEVFQLTLVSIFYYFQL